jgi:hypothetical protein
MALADQECRALVERWMRPCSGTSIRAQPDPRRIARRFDLTGLLAPKRAVNTAWAHACAAFGLPRALPV